MKDENIPPILLWGLKMLAFLEPTRGGACTDTLLLFFHLTSCTNLFTRQGLKSLANSESPLKRTKCSLYKSFSQFQGTLSMSCGINSTVGKWAGASSQFILPFGNSDAEHPLDFILFF